MSDNSWYEKGELPPVDVPCIVSAHNTQWGFCGCADHECKVICYQGDYCWIDLLCGGIPVATRVDKVDFRPIKTERELAIEQMSKDINLLVTNHAMIKNTAGLEDSILAKLYDAGYRKNES